jgi:hypothetical protein
MELYPSYVVESQIRHRRRVAAGVAGVLLLALTGAVALVVLAGVPDPDPRTGASTADCASGVRSHRPACADASLRPAG